MVYVGIILFFCYLYVTLFKDDMFGRQKKCLEVTSEQLLENDSVRHKAVVASVLVISYAVFVLIGYIIFLCYGLSVDVYIYPSLVAIAEFFGLLFMSLRNKVIPKGMSQATRIFRMTYIGYIVWLVLFL